MSHQTLYQRATEKMNTLIVALLDLSERTAGFTNPPDEVWTEDEAARLLLGGLGYHSDSLASVEQRKGAWLARSAIAFSIEHAVTRVLYERIQPFIDAMIETAYRETDNFRGATPEWIHENAHLLPVMMHAAGTFSKQELNRLVGSVNDTRISRPASERLAKLIGAIDRQAIARPRQVRERMRATTEGIVRDLVGRLLLEQFVASSLQKARVPYRRESEYDSLPGVVYDFRADFVIPDESAPRAFWRCGRAAQDTRVSMLRTRCFLRSIGRVAIKSVLAFWLSTVPGHVVLSMSWRGCSTMWFQSREPRRLLRSSDATSTVTKASFDGSFTSELKKLVRSVRSTFKS